MPGGNTAVTQWKPGLLWWTTKKIWMYTYHRLVFRDVSIRDTNDLLLQMYAADKAVAVDVIHYKDQNMVLKPYKISGNEKKTLMGE